jgi:branched-chain amino acid transport system permease protein
MAWPAERRAAGARTAVWVLAVLALLALLPGVLTSRTVFGFHLTNDDVLGFSLVQVNYALIAAVGALGLNLLTGYTGLISLGNAALLAVGALVACVVGIQWHAPFPVVFVAAIGVGAVVGTIVGLPSLRLSGIYLLLSTLALQFIMAYAFLWYQDKYFGPGGVNFHAASLFGFSLDSDRRWYFVLLALCAVVALLSWNLSRSRVGRALRAIRDHESAAASAGIDVPVMKLQVFALSSAVISGAGAMYVYYLTNASQDTFSLNLALEFVAMIIIGGLGSLSGALMGALLWQLLPQVLTTVSSSVGPTTPVIGHALTNYQPQVADLILGAIVIAIVLWRPDGLSGILESGRRRLREWPL